VPDQPVAARRIERLATYQRVYALAAQGLSVRATRRRLASKLDSFVPYLRRQWRAGQTNGMQPQERRRPRRDAAAGCIATPRVPSVPAGTPPPDASRRHGYGPSTWKGEASAPVLRIRPVTPAFPWNGAIPGAGGRCFAPTLTPDASRRHGCHPSPPGRRRRMHRDATGAICSLAPFLQCSILSKISSGYAAVNDIFLGSVRDSFPQKRFVNT
jgi:hypothetical protein